MDALSAENKKQAELLIASGLPEAKALEMMESVVAGPNPSGPPTNVYACLTIKPDADMSAVKEALEGYAAASKKTAGKVTCGHMMEGGQVTFIESFDSTNAMNIHIAYCFPSYSKMLAHVEMSEIVATTDPASVEWWNASLSAWGAKKFIVCAAM